MSEGFGKFSPLISPSRNHQRSDHCPAALVSVFNKNRETSNEPKNRFPGSLKRLQCYSSALSHRTLDNLRHGWSRRSVRGLKCCLDPCDILLASIGYYAENAITPRLLTEKWHRLGWLDCPRKRRLLYCLAGDGSLELD